ncbi:GTPase activating protein Ucp3 [Schizosaccharomyces cryophilus OY26]|uniref:GTPase activating protein Ucp3 n=1 Tax=Schizosaccharomyces cryophilus (strain OY26 / ATCC MYA-4695 / CBS 11777 / NBRC 106824 / NRRL Y48691) TaxID=653667 RepID=S9W2S3_SCHCR|nr:GTPase activating protein Ucp3 [Schizosaccharomyces cryophilus OY26]EPY52839.1 GTPase activating protein Ucp3 [Schizosaccharomyces cryophilus OY26]
MSGRRNETTIRHLIQSVPGNNICADCHTRGVQWASWNLGIFLCLRCATIHRKLGTHVSKIKSVSLDQWTDEQVNNMRDWGNINANRYWNPSPLDHPLPMNAHSDDNVMEKYIRDKYEKKLFLEETTNKKGPSLPPRSNASANSAGASSSRSNYKSSLKAIHDMGFTNDTINLKALEEAHGDINVAVEKIVQELKKNTSNSASSSSMKPNSRSSYKAPKISSARLSRRNKNLHVRFEDGSKPGDEDGSVGDTRATSPTLNPFEQMMAMTNQGMSVAPGVETTSSPFFRAPVEPNQPLQPSMTGPAATSSYENMSMPSYSIDSSSMYPQTGSSSAAPPPAQPLQRSHTGVASYDYNYPFNSNYSLPSNTTGSNPFYDYSSAAPSTPGMSASTNYPNNGNSLYYGNSYPNMTDNISLPDMSKLSLGESNNAPSNPSSQYLSSTLSPQYGASGTNFSQSSTDPYNLRTDVYNPSVSSYSAQPSTLQLQPTGLAPPSSGEIPLQGTGQPFMQSQMGMQSNNYQMPLGNTWMEYGDVSQQGTAMPMNEMNYPGVMNYDPNMPMNTGYYMQGYNNTMMPSEGMYQSADVYGDPMNPGSSGGMGGPASSTSNADNYLQRIMHGKR